MNRLGASVALDTFINELYNRPGSRVSEIFEFGSGGGGCDVVEFKSERKWEGR